MRIQFCKITVPENQSTMKEGLVFIFAVLVMVVDGEKSQSNQTEGLRNSPIIYYPTYYPVNQVFIPQQQAQPIPPQNQVLVPQTQPQPPPQPPQNFLIPQPQPLPQPPPNQVLVAQQQQPQPPPNQILVVQQQPQPVPPQQQQKPQQEVFDFIIVGSNSAGAVLANRLTEIGHWRVLLLEAGDVPNPIVDVPYSASSLHFTNYSWNHVYLKQDNFGYGFQDASVAATRGRVLGGSSVINYMLNTRGNSLDYDRWSSLGNPGWSFQEVLPYFLRLEDSRLSAQSEQYHAKGGYQTIENPLYFSQASHVFVQAAQEAGFKYRDFNGRYQKGVSYVQGTLRNGRRCSSEKAYLQPVKGRSNLRVITNARVTKILIDANSKTAHGVEFSRFRKKYLALAAKEVIISAGPLNSPQLLMLSGVGPKEHLTEKGIPLIHNLPVGKKLYDHLAFLGLAFTLNSSIVLPREQLEEPLAFLQFLETNQGPMASLSMIEAAAFGRTKVSKDTKSYPDIELLFLGGGFQTDRGLIFRKAFRISDETYNSLFKPAENIPIFQIFPILLHPQSFGYVKLKSSNPFSWPRAYGNFLNNTDDVETLLAGIREAQRIAQSPSFQKYNAQLLPYKLPACSNLDFDSDDYWRCAIRHLSAPFNFDQMGTCKMGPSFDPEAVVDSTLHVHGIKNLRVVDPSVLPLPLSGHTNIPATMIGEKAADLIKEYWKKFIPTG